MRLTRWLHLILLLSFLAACGKGTGPGTGISFFGPSATPRPPQVGVTHAPDGTAAINSFLELIQASDFTNAYVMLSKTSRESLTQEDFAKRWNDALNTMSAGSFDYQVTSAGPLNPQTAQADYHVTYHTVLVGDIQRDVVATLTLEEGQWRVQWGDGMILPELGTPGNQLVMDYQIPSRGDIYDRDGKPIVAQSDAYALGITPGQMTGKSEGVLVAELARVCGLSPEAVQDSYANAAPDWYVPICEITPDEAKDTLNLSLAGLVVTSYSSRFYTEQGIAPQVVGYTLSISPEELDAYRRLGYRGDEKVGSAGIEKSAEDYLAGKHGGSLYIRDPNGQIVAQLGSSPQQPADSIYLTIDRNLQFYTQQALRGFRGAAVVIERDTGRVLAMASTPDFDPNLFDPNNLNGSYLLGNLLNETDQPLVNRAAQGEYPLGSVFKIITFSAGLESGLYLPETTYDCQYDFNELVPLGGPVLHDWTWQHCQDALASVPQRFCNTSSTKPSGLLTFPQGLMRSCNPYFWHIGLDLYNNGRADDIAKMARAFGLGAPTGIDQIAEASGNISPPGNATDATSKAIGQADTLVTPLQVARFVAAVGNGGTLYRPQLIEKIQPVGGGDPISIFKPEAAGTLPLRPDNLKLLQDAMWSVVHDPRGTANFRLRELSIPVAGKTGTAESGSGTSHAWFAGYTLAAGSTGLPDIAVAVIMENAGEGSDYAAPVFQRILETYYYGAPQRLYWFESKFNVTRTPTPYGGIPTKTPKPK